MKRLIAFLFCSEESEFRQIYEEEFLGCEIKYRGIPVTFAERDFDHICFEAGTGGKSKSQFGIRRARRLLVAKQILEGEVPADLLYEENTGNYCLLCEALDMAIFLIPVSENRTLQIATIIHYGEGFTKRIQKQRGKSRKVDKITF